MLSQIVIDGKGMSEVDHIRVLVIGHNCNINDYKKIPVKENKVIIQKDLYEPKFDPRRIFHYKQISQIPLLGKIITKKRKREPCLIYIIGKDEVEGLVTSPDDPSEAKLFHEFTADEEKKIVNKYITKLLRSFKPISTGIAIVIILLLVANIIFTLMGLAGVHIR
jgi:hypothetical protein